MASSDTITPAPQRRLVPLVLGSYLNAYGLVRSLARHGVRSHLADSTKMMAGYSRHVTRWHWIPDPVTNPNASAEAIARIGRTCGPVILYPANAVWIDLIMNHYPTLAASCIIPFPAAEILRSCNDRVFLNEASGRAGLPTIRTIHWNAQNDLNEVVRTIIREFRFPVYVKPYDKGLAVKTIQTYCRMFAKAEELSEWARSVAKKAYEHQVVMALQEQVGGDDPENVAVQGYMNRQACLAGATSYWKVRQHPPQNGSALCAIIDQQDRLIDAAERVLSAIGYHGLFDLEFIRDRRTKELYCIDLNPRSGMLIYGSTVAGVNLPWLQYAEYSGRVVRLDDITYRGPATWWRVLGDVIYTALRRRTWTVDGIGAYVRSIWHRKAMADVDVSDPIPGLYEIVRLPERLFGGKRRIDRPTIETNKEG